MSEIAIDFLLGPGWSSKLIAWDGQGSGGYSHAASVLEDGRYLDARDDVIAGVPAGVQIRHPDTEKWIKKRRATLEVTTEDYAIWEASLRAKITDDYGKLDIFEGFILGRPGHLAGHWICSALGINAVQHVSRTWTAAGLVTAGMRRTGYVPYPLPIPAHSISPNAALLILATAGFTLGEEEFNGKS